MNCMRCAARWHDVQVSGLFSDLTVYDNLAFPMREHTDLSEEMIRDLVSEKLQAVGLRGAHALMPRICRVAWSAVWHWQGRLRSILR